VLARDPLGIPDRRQVDVLRPRQEQAGVVLERRTCVAREVEAQLRQAGVEDGARLVGEGRKARRRVRKWRPRRAKRERLA
jgi:hypothetical protein